MAGGSGVTDLSGRCAVHDEVIGNLKERDSRVESKIDAVKTQVAGVETKVDSLSLTIAKWAGAFLVLTTLGMACVTIAAKYLLP